MMRAQTTTWGGRNKDRLYETYTEAERLGFKRPSLVDIGPGGIVRFLAPYFPHGSKAEWTLGQQAMRAAAKLSDNLLRHTQFFPLATREPLELALHFQPMDPKIMYVVDRAPAVCAAAQRISTQVSFPLEVLQMDVRSGPLPRGDIVFAYNVHPKNGQRAQTLEAITNAVLPGGLLSMNIEDDLAGFQRQRRWLYRKSNHIEL